jgi:chromate reductase, NAD(P)H dehydrogenase (quinone)
MRDTFSILGIPGSLRKGSLNRGLLRAAQDLAPDGVEISIYDISDIPLYNGDIEAQGVPQPVVDFAEAIRAADAILIACPEYNYSIPGVLKNAIDWASRPSVRNPWRHKPIALMGASGGQFGTLRSQLALRQVFGSMIEAYVMLKPELYVNQAASKFDSDANLIDEDTRERLATHIESLVAWAHRLKVDVPVSASH